ncbi:hypothetical protein [Ectobacillus funiculus]|uniref:Uncharacterized protein n=1 Tax=Ectobacillus funiculus TaxID=137993 RepID=A0ABV5WEG2_9BACI
MNRPLIGIVVALLLFISLVLNLVFYGLWQQEKEERISTKTELREAKLRLETSKKNSPEQLTKKAEEFALTFLTYDKKYQSERKKRLLSLMSKGLGTKMLETKKEVSGEHIEGDNIISSAKIKDSIYNRINEKAGKVVLKVEQTLTSNSMKDTTSLEVTIHLEHDGKDWKVVKFDVKSIL